MDVATAGRYVADPGCGEYGSRGGHRGGGEKGGYVGWIKAGSQPETYQALLACWPQPEACGTWARGQFQEKGHGRWTVWDVEVCRLGPDMRRYLETTLGWPGVQVIGRYRVRQRDRVTGKERMGERFWLAGAAWEI